MNESLYQPDVGEFLDKLRKNIFNCTIEKLVYYMDWKNEKYYYQIVNGCKDGNGNKKLKNPTINYVFGGLNFALKNFEEVQEKRQEIIDLIFKYIIKY